MKNFLNYLIHNEFLNKWFFVGINYKIVETLYFQYGTFLGASYFFFIRSELTTPGSQWLMGNNHFYNTLFTSHRHVMIFAAMPILIWGFGNLMVPLLIRASDMVSLCLNNLSFCIWIKIIKLLKKFKQINNKKEKNDKKLF